MRKSLQSPSRVAQFSQPTKETPTMAMRFHAKIQDFIDLLHVYPTMAEALKIVAISPAGSEEFSPNHLDGTGL
jgi:hypothetical protein